MDNQKVGGVGLIILEFLKPWHYDSHLYDIRIYFFGIIPIFVIDLEDEIKC